MRSGQTEASCPGSYVSSADLSGLPKLAALAERLGERAARHDASATICRANLDDLHAAGCLALTVPREHGGGGGGLRQAAAVIRQIAQSDPATALIVTMQHLQHAAITRLARWPEPLSRLVRLAAVQDGALLNALRVEPELGTPARGGLPATLARREADGWTLSGRKIYSTGSRVLRWGVTWARTDEEEPRVGNFLVPMRAPGVSIVESWNQLGMRATESHTVVLEDVAIPLDHAVDVRAPADWGALDAVHAVWGNVLIACLYDGIARAARRWFLSFLRERAPSNLGTTLATLPRFHEIVGEIDALLLTNRLMLEAAVAGHEGGEPIRAAEGPLLKHVVTDNAIRAVERALSAVGNPGLSREHPLERHYRDVLCGRVHTPQSDAALALSGRLSLQG